MESVALQKQIRDNAEELQVYLKELSLWNKEMKRKEAELEDNVTYSKEIPPVRSKSKKVKIVQENSSKQQSQRISGSDYSSWEKFDAEKACDEVDAESSQSETEMEVPPQVQYRLREEAAYEKEKGNQFVKSQKWEDAIKCYTRAIKCYPHDAIFYANRALCFLKTKDFKAAETDCTSAVQLDDTYVKAYQRRAAARAQLNQLHEAIADLRTVLELEPKNTASRQELAKLEANMRKDNLSQKVKSIDHVDVKPAAQESRSWSSVTAIPGPSGLSQIKKSSTKKVKCSTNQNIVNKNKIVVIGTDEPASEATVNVEPIQKPPHLRSKKPMRRIKIEEFDSSRSSAVASRSETEVNQSPDQQASESQNPQSVNNTIHASTDERISSPVHITQHVNVPEHSTIVDVAVEAAGEDGQGQVPPPPVSSMQFLVAWNKVKGNSKLMYLYLKQICGADLPKLFQDSLESNILSSILSTLANEFVVEGSPTYSYLQGLSKVRRFSTLSFFLSKEEKECVRKLLGHCIRHGECTENEAAVLKEKYEL